jgi:hypothetical protein
MGDYAGSLMQEPDGSLYYADDYLLLPAHPKYAAHTSPGANRSFEPYFRRAVRALRTETSPNTARWIGTLLHFTEDPGAPPHALAGMGDLHHNMENWVTSEKITITGYKPKLLASTEEEALAGYLLRMEGLIAFSSERAEKIKPLVAANNREAAKPLILECALESSRVVADLLYTLGRLDLSGQEGSVALRRTVNPGLASMPDKRAAKVVLLGTDYSTLTDASSRYESRDLPQ